MDLQLVVRALPEVEIRILLFPTAADMVRLARRPRGLSENTAINTALLRLLRDQR